MINILLQELEQEFNNFDVQDIIDYQLLLITSHKATIYFETSNIDIAEKNKFISLYEKLLTNFNFNKILSIQELNTLFNPPGGKLDINNKENYITLFNLIIQEWRSEDNIYSYKMKSILNAIIQEINNSFNIEDENENETKFISENNIQENQQINTNNHNNGLFNYDTKNLYPNFENDFEIKNKNYLKEYIVAKNMLEYKCARCGLTSWQNNPLSLHLHSKDGVYSNFNLINLEFLCPNCYSQIGD